MRIWLSCPHMGGTECDCVNDAFDSIFVAPVGPHLNAFERVVNGYLGGALHWVGLCLPSDSDMNNAEQYEVIGRIQDMLEVSR